MTDRELAGCAKVMRYYHSADGISTMDPDDDGPWVAWTDYAELLAKYEALLSRAPSRDAERLDWLCSFNPARRVEGVMGFRVYEDVAPMDVEHCHWVALTPRFYETPREAIDAAIAAAERENHG